MPGALNRLIALAHKTSKAQLTSTHPGKGFASGFLTSFHHSTGCGSGGLQLCRLALRRVQVAIEKCEGKTYDCISLLIEEKTMQKYVCDLCGYVYDPAEGDSSGGVKPGTAFPDIDSGWVCPLCGAGKDQFYPVK